MKHFFFILTCLLLQTVLFAQNDTCKDSFDYLIAVVHGNLNKDHLPDKAVVTQDTINKKAPFRLQLFFKEPGGQYRLVESSTQIIEPQYPDGKDGFYTGNSFLKITIRKGVLCIRNELLKGHYEYFFRYQHNRFELIGFSESQSDGRGKMYFTDFNLITGIKIKQTDNYETGKMISRTKTKLLLRPFPAFRELVPFENDHFLY